MDLYDSSATEEAILAVLAGTPIADAATRIRASPERLAEAIELYRAAGRAVLDARHNQPDWHQVNVEFADYRSAELSFTAHVLPSLQTAADMGTVTSWWFVRKHPCWRLRIAPAPDTPVADVVRYVADTLDCTVAQGAVRRWRPSLYEPEASAFGGADGMKVAHGLFHADSIGVLDYLHRAETDTSGLLGAKATSFLVISLFLRAAAQEWSEQGDVWARVEAKRPLPEGVSMGQVTAMTSDLRTLLAIDPGPALATGGPLAPLAKWISELQYFGRAIADAGHEGRLSLGTRAILARHILFHWNRMGFTTRQQAIWARAAREAILGD